VPRGSRDVLKRSWPSDCGLLAEEGGKKIPRKGKGRRISLQTNEGPRNPIEARARGKHRINELEVVCGVVRGETGSRICKGVSHPPRKKK